MRGQKPFTKNMPIVQRAFGRVGLAHQRAIDSDLDFAQRPANIAVAIIENNIAIGDFGRARFQRIQHLFGLDEDINLIAGLGRAGDFAPLNAVRLAAHMRHGLPSIGRRQKQKEDEQAHAGNMQHNRTWELGKNAPEKIRRRAFACQK